MLSAARVRQIADALFRAPKPADDRRASGRLAVGAAVRVRPFDGAAFDAEVRDVSREGVALVTDREMRPGGQFDLVLPEPHGDLLASVRHVRAEGRRFVVGARFGADWMSVLAATMRPNDRHVPAAKRVQGRVR